MATGNKRAKPDADVRAVEAAFVPYRDRRPEAQVTVKRQNSVSIRLRIIDPAFAGQSYARRDDAAWKVLSTLPEEIQSQMTMVLLLTPDERNASIANLDFENPVKSNL